MSFSFLDEHVSLRRLALAGAAALVGALAGVSAIAFWFLVSRLQTLLFGTGPEDLASAAGILPWWQVLLVPAAGGLVIGFAINKLLRPPRPTGVADVIESSALTAGHLPLRNGLLAAAVNAGSIATGASVGREGPLVHLGATLGAWVRHRLRLPDFLARRLLGCGVAAGIAASFNAPIAGAVFAIEVVVGKYSLHTFGPVAIGSIAGTIVSRVYYGDHPAFEVTPYSIGPLPEFPAFAMLGIVSAAAAFGLLKTTEVVRNAHLRFRTPELIRPALAGVAVGAIALLIPEVLGVGYDTTSNLLNQRPELGLVLALVIAKILATSLSLGSGFGGGIFSPSIVLGAATGAAFAGLLQLLFPQMQTAAGAFAMVGMGATAGAVLGAPLSTTIIVFEMTGNYSLTIAVMLAVIISSTLVNDLWGRSFFSWQLANRGLSLGQSESDLLMNQVRARDLLRPAPVIVQGDAALEEVAAALERSDSRSAFVVGPDNAYLGRIGSPRLRQALVEEGNRASPLRAADICGTASSVRPDDSLHRVLQALRHSPADPLPVVSAETPAVLAGCIPPEAAWQSYQGILDKVYGSDKPYG